MKYKQEGVLPSSDIYLHMPSEFARRTLFYAEMAGDASCTPAWQIERGFFDMFVLFYIRSGELAFHDPSRDFAAGPDSIVLFCCKGAHAYTARVPSAFSWVHINGYAVQPYYDLLTGQGHAPVFSGAACPVAVTLFGQVMEELRGGRTNDHRVSACIGSLLGELAMPGGSRRTAGDPAVLEAASYIEGHFAEELSLEKIAAHVNLSPYHFSRQFKRFTGSSPYEFLLAARIQQAKKLLLSSQLPIETIAARCGFNSLSSFIRAFKRAAGLTPGQFREMRF